MSNIKKLSANANAKLNLHLEVFAPRHDGYHDISTLFQSVNLADDLEVTLTDDGIIRVETENIVIEGENIAEKAALLFFDAVKSDCGALIKIKKNIPALAGLAGGSADAAAVLLILNELLNHPLNDESLRDIGKKLGADVPFCIMGGTALAEGIGEKLSPIDYLGDYFVILIKHHKKSSTGDMYRRLDKRDKIGEKVSRKIISCLKCGEINSLKSLCRNDFLMVSDNQKEQTEIINRLYDEGAVLAGLSGSGPTLYGIFEKDPTPLFNRLKLGYNKVYLCKTADFGIKTE